MASSQSSVTKDDKSGDSKTEPSGADLPKPAAALEEDDEFEDFPVDGKSSTAVLLCDTVREASYG